MKRIEKVVFTLEDSELEALERIANINCGMLIAPDVRLILLN